MIIDLDEVRRRRDDEPPRLVLTAAFYESRSGERTSRVDYTNERDGSLEDIINRLGAALICYRNDQLEWQGAEGDVWCLTLLSTGRAYSLTVDDELGGVSNAMLDEALGLVRQQVIEDRPGSGGDPANDNPAPRAPDCA